MVANTLIIQYMKGRDYMNINKTEIEMDKALRDYYMTYSMKTIVDRALPDVRDGLKPVARRILYQMYKNKFDWDKKHIKTSTVVSEVMKIHFHGDTGIANAIAKMTDKNESLIHPYINGEGSFGKIYNLDKPSASRYTFVRLEEFTNTMFDGLNKNSVAMIGEDKSSLQPIVLPTMFPNILVKPNSGMAVGQKTNLCSFNLKEVCELTKAYMINEDIDVIDYLKAPDLSTGGYLLYDRGGLEKLYNTGLGNFKLRAKYRYEEDINLIDIYEIPYTTTDSKIVQEITALMKTKRFKEILDVRPETGFNEKLDKDVLSIAIDVKKNTNIDKLMLELFSCTSLEDTYTCRFGALVNYEPRTLTIKQMLDEWLKFRKETLTNIINYDIMTKSSELDRLYGIKKIMIDIDETIRIIKTNKEKVAIELLKKTFDLNDAQSEYVSDLKLKYLSIDNLEKQIIKIEQLNKEINYLEVCLTEEKLTEIICQQLTSISEKYGKERKTEILENYKNYSKTKEDLISDYNVVHIYTKEGYYKKIPLTSYSRTTTSDNKIKEGDYVELIQEGTNLDDLLAFTDKGNIYRIKVSDIEDKKLKDFGEYLYNKLNLKDEVIIGVAITDYKNEDEFVLLSYKKGTSVKIPLIKYKSNYSCLKGNVKDILVSVEKMEVEKELFVVSEKGMCLNYNSSDISLVGSKTAKGVVSINLNEGDSLLKVITLDSLTPFNVLIETEGGLEESIEIDVESYTSRRSNKGKSLGFKELLINIRKELK